ncbi:MAG: hypothetical protein IJZ63_00330 [Clostridia bacterium]|nr:hypothetical protein [Clostridia bacterium]
MVKRIVTLLLAFVMAFAAIGCGEETAEPAAKEENKTPQYAEKQFEISGFWAPYDISEEGLKEYKDVGFTTLAMINHSLGATSEEQFYFGSQRTMTALENCKKVGLNAILNYNDWMVPRCEEEGYDFYGDTPFSKHDIYGEYKDIITGIHICDEPYLKREDGTGTNHFALYGDKTLIDDFKKVYPNAKFIVNLIPITAVSSRGFTTYEEMMELYEKTFMEPFENPFVSVDVYPFHQGNTQDDGTLLVNYQYIADSAKKYGVKPGYILQSSVGGADEGRKEFEMELSESDLRWEVNNALLFGADTLQYYCYSVPKSFDENGKEVFMYDYCILNRDDTPSPIYYSLQKIHKEIQSYSNVILSYDWQQVIGKSGYDVSTYRVAPLEIDDNFEAITFDNAKKYVETSCSQDVAISHFTSKDFGEAYMFVNWADRGVKNEDGTLEKVNNIVTAKFKDCSELKVYGGVGFDGTPKTLKLDKNGEVQFELEYGEGIFVVPVA